MKSMNVNIFVLYLVVPFGIVQLSAFAQELEPRAITNVPVGTNFVAANYSYAQGNILFDPALPLEDVQAKTHALIGGFVSSFNFFGMSAKLNVILPYAYGDWEGIYQAVDTTTQRNGMADLRFGFAFNFIGSPALKLSEFSTYEQNTIAGFSLQMIAPTGQYFSDKLINLGSNRWAFRPQFGFSKKINTWYVEGALASWFYTRNRSFWDGNTLQQKPIGVTKLHLIKTLDKGVWLAFCLGYAYGGRSFVNDQKSKATISTMRIGAVTSIPLKKSNSIKLMAFKAIRFEQGADFFSLNIAYQYNWNYRKN